MIGILDVYSLTAQVFNVPLSKVMSKERARVYSRPRQAAWLVMRECTERSFPEIGRKTGHDHTSVLSGVREAKRYAAQSEDYLEAITRVRQAALANNVRAEEPVMFRTSRKGAA